MKKILFLGTGGTIASSEGEEGLIPTLSAEDLINAVPELEEICEIEAKLIMSKDSSNMQPEDWVAIAENAYEGIKQFDGIVIAHGTDTMAYTSSALTFMLQNINKPVVVTGSQLPLIQEGTDAKRNIVDAFKTACEDIAGVFVVFNGKIIKGCRASKLRTTSFNAFESINYPYIGIIEENGIRYNEKPLPKEGQTPKLNTSLSPDVFLLKLIPGTRPDILDAVMQLNYKGVVIESFGAGGVPFDGRDLLPKIEEMLEKGIPVAITTQCLFEGVDLTVYQVGQKTLKKGVIPAYDMTTEALVTKLMWALGQTSDLDEVKKIMLTDFAGEINIK